ncbi:Putative acyltransferase 3 domain-containing protein [Colletotrichum destructivum]|uniref:Acyltransferase 3 domain-containing protein n=1 Tax=Colletotrichum destructivum TaxID=34406 RepID=A0AAX4I535_9PEZI|nr:Putative acyltransferase 3 domain-containing protein [Colletotrichum destructivum]
MISLAVRSIRGAVARFSPTYSYSLLSDATPQSDPSLPASSSPTPQSKSFLAKLTAILFFLLPSFVQRRLRPSDKHQRRRLYATSWLDGLRGVASLIVFICHYSGPHFGYYLARPYGIPDENDHVASSPLQLPFLRVIYSGKPMVHIFFVISGFVLSLKSLQLVRKHNYEALHRTLSSSVFRRGFRLFLPTTASTFIIMIMIRLGWMGQPLPTLWEQLVDWKNGLWKITFSWQWDITQFLPYDVHLWTIPIEFSNSLLLFVTLVGVSRMKTYLRLLSVVGIMIYCLKCGHWAAFEFFGGMVLAEVGLIQEARRERAAAAAAVEDKEAASDTGAIGGGINSWSSSVTTLVLKAFLLGNLIFALFVAGWPDQVNDITPGIAPLFRNTMEPYFTMGGDLVAFPWYALGAVQIVAALQQIKVLQNLFITPLAQYLADISYALYLCHGPVLDVFEHRWMPYVWALVGGRDEAGMWGRMVAWFIGLLTLGVPTIWASDVFWRTIDVKSVELSRWIESFCTQDD